MKLTVVDAFTDCPFSGNPAAVTVLDAFPADAAMQAVAREMNLSETSFVVPRADGEYDLRWFTPTVEVDLCGHATLAAAFLLGGSPVFHTRSGRLACRTDDGRVEMDFPARPPVACPLAGRFPEGLPEAKWTGRAGEDWFVELDGWADVVEARPDPAGVVALGGRALIVTAAGHGSEGDADFVSRFFAPNAGIPEDPVTGSAHCALGPYWAERLGRTRLTGYQASARGGTVTVEVQGERVRLGGRAVRVSEVTLLVQP